MNELLCKRCNNKNDCILKDVVSFLDHDLLKCKDFEINEITHMKTE